MTPAQPRPKRLPTVKPVPGKAGPKKYRARSRVAGQTKEIWGETADEALQAWIDWFRESRAPQPPSPTSTRSSKGGPAPATMRGLFEAYLPWAKDHRAPTTYSRYESQIRTRLMDRFGDFAFPVDSSEIQAYIDELIALDWATTSIARERTVLQAAFRFASRTKKWISGNPAHDLEAPAPKARLTAQAAKRRQRAPEVDIPSADEVLHFLEANRDDELIVMWYAGFTLGLRDGELCAMSLHQIEAGPSGKAEWVLVHEQLERTRPKPGMIVSVPVKDASYRELRLPPGHEVFRALLGQAKRMRDAAEAAKADGHPWPKEWAGPGYLFLRTEKSDNGRAAAGTPWAPDQIPGRFKTAAAKAGWPESRTPHQMRHYAISALLEAGLSIPAVAQWSGHKTLRVIEETYAHVIRRASRTVEISEALEAIKLPAPTPNGVQNGVQDTA